MRRGRKGTVMKQNQPYMAFQNAVEAIVRADVTVEVFIEWLDEHGHTEPTEQDAAEIAAEIEYRMYLKSGEIFALALCQWVDSRYPGVSTEVMNAAKYGGIFHPDYKQ